MNATVKTLLVAGTLIAATVMTPAEALARPSGRSRSRVEPSRRPGRVTTRYDRSPGGRDSYIVRTERVLVEPGHYELRREEVLVEAGHYELRRIPASRRVIRDRRGRIIRIIIEPARVEKVWVPDRFETRTVRVWVPARYEMRSVRVHRPRPTIQATYRTGGWTIGGTIRF